MILLKIFDVKNTMAGLLLHEDYDFFYLEEAKVVTFTKLQLSGFRNRRWYDSEDAAGFSEYVSWKEVRPFIFSYIRGKRTPDYFQISLRAPEEYVKKVLQADFLRSPVDFLLHFRFENGGLSVITGCFYHEFTMDKKEEFAWDEEIRSFFRKKKIAYEEQ